MTTVKILSDREHVIKRPNMYIGSTSLEKHERFLFGEYKVVEYVPGLVKIIDEIIDNCIDEAIRTNFKHANKIEVSFNGDLVTIRDNGRGIPQGDVETPEGTLIPGPVAAWTRTKAGANFDNDEKRVTMGMNGVGSSLTNFFSIMFEGVTCNGENTVIVKCTNGAENISWNVVPGGRKGTQVTFAPDFDHFEGFVMNQAVKDIILDRIQTLSVVFPQIEFKLNGKKQNLKFKKYAEMFDSKVVLDTDVCSIAFASSPDGFRQVGYVNGLNIKNGGSHVDMIINNISDEVIPIIKKKHKIEITKARIKECLTMVTVIRNMPNLKFDSQTKERLTNTHGEVRNHIELDYKKLAKQIVACDDLIMPVIEAVLARKLAAEKAAATKASKAAAKAKVPKHIKANYYGRAEDTTLFLTEGDSAIGMLLKVRNPDTHGGFALRGKFMNTWGMKEADVLKNKEAFNIMSITGLEFNEPANMAYKNIGILVDADVDGKGSIYPSLLAFFSRWPDLFEKGRIRFIKTPIVIAEKGKDVKWYYELADYENEKQHLKNHEVRYIKGLGSLREKEYKKVINEPVYDTVRLDDNYKELFEMLFGDDANLRKTWMS